ncbi:hypothetical protein VaNZ11_011653 [Volvox africanus]|uniref:phytol kinase n=1 Tax=Volvox africanus TaxID=51714 RepID=A0ABQ5SC29_9CHLO|nr:hypothetical protein VaNZ11_011653 [Volvox africanus]
MGDSSPSQSSEPRNLGALVCQIIPASEGETMDALYRKISRDKRTWRCEQTKKSSDLLQRAWELLRPIAEGRWDKENAYNGLSLLIKGIYEGQGYAAMPYDMTVKINNLLQIVQDNMPYMDVNGRRAQGDDSPARYALRVSFVCVSLVVASSLSLGAGQRGSVEAETVLLQSKAKEIAVTAMDKLGGPLTHEGTLTAEDKAYIARLATASGPEVQHLVVATPMNVLALYMLQVQYDIEMRVIKWVLNYVAALCAKQEFSRALSQSVVVQGPSARAAPLAAWVRHSSALGKLEPASPLSGFMVAEARAAEGPNTQSLALMKAAAEAAERRGDDLLAWLARLDVAELLMHGAQGPTFSEGEVLQEFEKSAAQEASAKSWGGAFLLESQCRANEESLKEALQSAREQHQKQLAETGLAATAEDDGRLPSVKVRGDWKALAPGAVSLRECASCKKLFQKAMTCGKCKQVWYCGRDCQMAHWRAGHREECVLLAKAAAKAAASKSAADDDI